MLSLASMMTGIHMVVRPTTPILIPQTVILIPTPRTLKPGEIPMSRMQEDLDITYRVLKRLAAPNHPFRSFSHVARRERLTDDKTNRAVARARALVNADLTALRDNRLVLTPLGAEFLALLERLLALAGSQADPVETIRVGIAPEFDPSILVPAVTRFAEEWGGLVAVQLSVLADGGMEAVDSGSLSFCVTMDEEGTADPDQRIEPAVPLSILIPKGHRLTGAGAIDADHFAANDLLLLAPGVQARAGDLISRVPLSRRIEIVGCSETLRRLVADGCGLGVAFAHPFRSPLDSFSYATATGIAPLRFSLALPRRRGSVSEPMQALIAALRDAGREAALPPTPKHEAPAEEFGSLPDLSMLPEPMPS